jgi:hypothetical protein
VTGTYTLVFEIEEVDGANTYMNAKVTSNDVTINVISNCQTSQFTLVNMAQANNVVVPYNSSSFLLTTTWSGKLSEQKCLVMSSGNILKFYLIGIYYGFDPTSSPVIVSSTVNSASQAAYSYNQIVSDRLDVGTFLNMNQPSSPTYNFENSG